MKILSIAIIWALYKVWPLFIVIVLALVIVNRLAPPPKRHAMTVVVGFLLLVLCVVSAFFLRPMIVGFLTNYYGEVAQGKVVSSAGLSRIHNEQRVFRSHIIYKTVDGQLIETFFDSDDYNFYPFRNSVRYPAVGQEFSLKYIPELPQYVIILRDEKKEQCEKLRLKLYELQNKLQFAPDNADFLREIQELLAQIEAQGC